MKEASGELNMTVITIIAIAALSTLFGVVILPMIRNGINSQWDQLNNSRENYDE